MQTWESEFTPGASVYLVEGGAILRPANDPSAGDFGGPGLGGRIERIAWDGTVEWSYLAAGPDYVQHHDIELLPNGNVLAIVWERHTAADAIANGRDPARVGAEVWSESRSGTSFRSIKRSSISVTFPHQPTERAVFASRYANARSMA